jgi:hypothetical protein
MTTYAKILDFLVEDVITTYDPEYYMDPAYVWVDVSELEIPPLVGWSWENNSTVFHPPNDGYGQAVSIAKDATYVYYTAGNKTYTFPVATTQAAAYLSMAKQVNLSSLLSIAHDYVACFYDIPTRLNFNVLYISAVKEGLTNRANYIEQFMPWINAIMTYATTYTATINAMTDIATVVATTPDFTTTNSSKPSLTLLGAFSINY